MLLAKIYIGKLLFSLFAFSIGNSLSQDFSNPNFGGIPIVPEVQQSNAFIFPQNSKDVQENLDYNKQALEKIRSISSTTDYVSHVHMLDYHKRS